MKNSLYLVDVSSIFFRSFYAIRNLKNSKGFPTNAVYGFVAAITKILKEHNPGGIVFCLDRPEDGFREELYSDYKANRDAPPDDLQLQFPYIKKVAHAFNIPCFDQAGYEADDIIGTMAVRAKQAGTNVIIVSGDKDFAQLVEPGIRLFDPAKDAYMDAPEVKAKWGINPDQVIDYLSLVGDSSDNVPGVAGIGPKGAQKLLEEFQNLDNLFANVDRIPNERLREKLRNSHDMAMLSKKLVTIHKEVPLNFELEALNIQPIRRQELMELLQELEFKSLLQRYLGNDAQAAPSVQQDPGESTKTAEILPAVHRPAKNVEHLQELVAALGSHKEIWIDATDRGISIGTPDAVITYTGDANAFKSWLSQSAKDFNLGAYDSKDLFHWCNSREIQGLTDDLLLASYCLGDRDKFDFEFLVFSILDRKYPEFASSRERVEMAQEMMTKVLRQLEERKTAKVYRDIECKLVPVLYEMERNGVRLDCQELEFQSKSLTSELQQLEVEICKLAGESFNIGSPKQLSKILFDKLKLPVIRKTKTGLSTDSDVLEKLKAQHPICEKILDWREISKLKSTYVDILPRLIHPDTGRVHTTFAQAVTTTGRLSSHNPNLQNIPIRTERGSRIRNAFVASPGRSLISADYSQVELRILAHIADDKNLKRAFAEDLDIHQATASEVFNVPLSDVSGEQRRAAKAINFGIVYGMSDFGLSENLGIDRREAANYIDRYFKKYPGVAQYMHDVVEKAKQYGFVKTLFGRRKYYPLIRSTNRRVAQMVERAVINMPIQGSAADIIKLAMIQIYEKLKTEPGNPKMLLQVHDELIFEVDDSEAAQLAQKVKTWMETAVQLTVPIKVSSGVGKTWGSAH